MRVAAIILSGVAFALSAVTARAEASDATTSAVGAATAMAYAESPADSLARNLRILATEPQDFNALIGAGKAALALDDTQAAAGFFGRAQERWPTSPLPMIGMGAALVSDGDANGALIYFRRAEALGAGLLTMAADRGLAYDMQGRHAEAQADYRVALAGPDRNEARRRLALSLAITGKRDEALATLTPLVAMRDSGAVRCRALVMALSGDTEGAKRTIETAMPGSSAQMGPFFRRLPGLSSPQKVAAVNLGIFPNNGLPAYTGGISAVTASNTTNPVTGNRLADIEALLSGQAVSQPAPQSDSMESYSLAPAASPPVQMASIPQRQVRASTAKRQAPSTDMRAPASAKRYWVQLASGSNAAALPQQFHQIRRRSDDMLDGLSPYIANDGGRARLLIGPFKDSRDASDFAQALESSRIDAFSWVSQPGQTVRKLSTE